MKRLFDVYSVASEGRSSRAFVAAGIESIPIAQVMHALEEEGRGVTRALLRGISLTMRNFLGGGRVS